MMTERRLVGVVLVALVLMGLVLVLNTHSVTSVEAAMIEAYENQDRLIEYQRAEILALRVQLIERDVTIDRMGRQYERLVNRRARGQ